MPRFPVQLAIMLLLPLLLLYVLLQTSTVQKGILITDANNYFCHAERFDQGAVLYRDIHHANMPGVSYVAWLYRTLTFRDLHAFNATAAVEAAVVTCLIFLIALRLHKRPEVALLIAFVYLFSTVVLSTSRFQNAIFTALLATVSAYYLLLRGKPIFAGIAAGVAIAIKLYMAPVLGALLIACWLEDRKTALRFFGASVLTGFLILLPTLILAPNEFLRQILSSTLRDGPAESRWNVIWYFLSTDWLIALLIFAGCFLWSRNRFLVLANIFGIVFFVIFRDVYLLYFNLLVPAAVLGLGYLMQMGTTVIGRKTTLAGVVTVLIVAVTGAIRAYSANLQTGIIPDEDSVRRVMRQYRPDAVFGSSALMQGISSATGVPNFNNYCDLHPNLFASGQLDREKITEQVVSSRTMVVLTAAENLPRITTYGTDFTDVALVMRRCRRVHQEPMRWHDRNVAVFYMCGER
ncbi:MAG: hypothetical protein N2691_04855 [Patescibacteria group bacterium]|nr:hypothetical protein [Patescibacteria group bacterium]